MSSMFNNGCISHFFIILFPIGVMDLLKSWNNVPLSVLSKVLLNISRFCKVTPSKIKELCDLTGSYSFMLPMDNKLLSSCNHFK